MSLCFNIRIMKDNGKCICDLIDIANLDLKFETTIDSWALKHIREVLLYTLVRSVIESDFSWPLLEALVGWARVITLWRYHDKRAFEWKRWRLTYREMAISIQQRPPQIISLENRCHIAKLRVIRTRKRPEVIANLICLVSFVSLEPRIMRGCKSRTAHHARM